MSLQTTILCFFGVLAAYCRGLEFGERGEFEEKLFVKFECALAIYDSEFSLNRMLLKANNSTILYLSVRNTCFRIVRHSLPVENNLVDVTKGYF